MKTGVLQGDVLAPYLFIVVIDWVMRNSNIEDLGFITHKRISRRTPEQKIGDLEYADDISLLENETHKAQQQIDSLSDTAKEVGLLINIGKTKVLSKHVAPNPRITIDGIALEVVDDFQYLGAFVNDTMRDFNYRKAKAWLAFWKLKKIWRSNATIDLKVKFFNASVLSVLLYATETYVMNANIQKKINSFQTSCLRIILNIKRTDRVRNEQIYNVTKTKPLMSRVTKTQLSFIGHSIRRDTNDLIQKYCLFVPTYGHRNRGRQKTTFKQHIAKTIYDDANVEERTIRNAASDRAEWRDVVKAASRFFEIE